MAPALPLRDGFQNEENRQSAWNSHIQSMQRITTIPSSDFGDFMPILRRQNSLHESQKRRFRPRCCSLRPCIRSATRSIA